MQATRTKLLMVNRVANLLGMKPKEVQSVVDTFMQEVMDQVAKGYKVQFMEFGIFEKKLRAPRRGRNPQTGEEMQIPARVVPTFKPSKGFKEKVNTLE